ncbi:MAG: hypothetical protein ACOX1E_03850 [Erysipelotrichaceae bacterium]|jgi:hypothetical protein
MDAKELLEKIKEEFRKRFKEKESFSDYKQVQSYAVEIAEKSSKAVISNLDDSLINEFGTLDYNTLNEVLTKLFKDDYKLIADACVIAQTEMNKNANIGLKAIAPKYDDDRAHSIVWDMAQRNLESFKQAYPTYTDNFYQSTVDEVVRANADFQWKSGLEPKVTRLAKYDCCKWCQSLEGTYRYEDVSDSGNDVWRRHRNCRCLIVYAPGKGKAKDVRTQKPIDNKELQKRLDFVKEQEAKKYKKYEDVTKYYFSDATPGRGTISWNDDYKLSDNKNEYNIAKLIHKYLGGDIFLITKSEIEGVKSADYFWLEQLWDLKSPSSYKAIDDAVRRGLKQIAKNPGGIIINFTGKEANIDKIIDEIIDRVKRSGKGNVIDVIIIIKNKIKKIIRIT